jgi:hypothetical protein
MDRREFQYKPVNTGEDVLLQRNYVTGDSRHHTHHYLSALHPGMQSTSHY